MKKSDYIISPEIWKTLPLPDGQNCRYVAPENISPENDPDAVFHADPQRPYYFNVESFRNAIGISYETVKKTIAKLHMGSVVNFPEVCCAHEWGYGFCVNVANPSGERKYPAPKNRDEAMELVNQWIKETMETQYNSDGIIKHPLCSMNGHYLWHHYGAEFGADFLGSEIGENIDSYQMMIAFNRGAARQYKKPWFMQFSPWLHGAFKSYINKPGKNKFGNDVGPDCGHSDSMFERSYYISYMAGPSAIRAEAGIAYFFIPEENEDGIYPLTPLGEKAKAFCDFTDRHPDVGTAYTPFGIVLDFYHGTYGAVPESPGDIVSGQKAFEIFNYNDGDRMSWKLLDMFFPGSWFGSVRRNETCNLVPTPYGDTCDVLLQNAGLDVLRSYPVLILSGDIKFSSLDALKFSQYVRLGGTLVLNSAYLSAFPHWKEQVTDISYAEIKDGEGTVIVYGNDYETDKLDGIIKDLSKKLVPFAIEGEIEYSVNVRDSSMIVTLVNSKGFVKNPTEKPQIDLSETKEITVTFTGTDEVRKIVDIQSDAVISENQKELYCTVKPGEVAIFEFHF